MLNTEYLSPKDRSITEATKPGQGRRALHRLLPGLLTFTPLLLLSACSQSSRIVDAIVQTIEAVEGTQRAEVHRRPTDPPYGPVVILPSGLRLDLVGDAGLTASYPEPGDLPFASRRRAHYQPPEYFIDISALSTTTRNARASTNFSVNEYVRLPDRNGDRRCYIDAQIAQHVQDLREAWGGPLILNSTFRSPRFNAAIGGAVFSRHMYGDALDVAVPDARRARDFYNLALAIGVDFVDAFDNTISADGSGWVHIDDRGF